MTHPLSRVQSLHGSQGGSLSDLGVRHWPDQRDGGWVQLCEDPGAVTFELGHAVGAVFDPMMCDAVARFPTSVPSTPVPELVRPKRKSRRTSPVVEVVVPLLLFAVDTPMDCVFTVEFRGGVEAPIRDAVDEWAQRLMAPNEVDTFHGFELDSDHEPGVVRWSVDLGSFDLELREGELGALRTQLAEAAANAGLQIKSIRFEPPSE